MTNPSISASDDDLVADLAQAAAELTAEEFKAYFRLRDYQRTRGRVLPPREKNLAVIAGVTLNAFRNMRPALSDFVSLGHVPTGAAPEPEKDPTKQAAGKLGAQRRWEKTRGESRDAIDPATGRAIDPAMQSAIEPMAGPMANGMANRHAGRHEEPPRTHGQSVGFSNSKIDSKTDRPTVAGTRADDGGDHGSDDGAGDGTSHGGDDGAPDGKEDGAGQLLAITREAGTGGQGSSSATIGDVASAMAKVLDEPPRPTPDDREIIAALRRAGGGKIPSSLLTPSGIRPIRVLIELGCELERDIVPAFEAVVKPLPESLRSLRARFVHEACLAHRDDARIAARAANNVSAQTPGFFVAYESAQWIAWLAHLGRRSHAKMDVRGRGQGWWFPTEWPPESGGAHERPPLKTAVG